MTNTVSDEFWSAFQANDMDSAVTALDALSAEDKKSVLSELFQKSQYQQTPHSVSVLFRELHDDKTFDDFHEAWFPPKDKLNPQEVHGQTYQQYFPVPIRVINGVNIENPKEIVSIGMHWMTDEQAKDLMAEASKGDKVRGDSINEVAERMKTGIFMVESDDNLGTPFK
tara:strand:+ start:35992 stop:36498 length:507 start_codon:yes stop_codon:yes gene_type:complete